MKVRLWTDAPMANIALMKLSTYHKERGDDVAFHNPIFDVDAELLYCSKLFAFTPDYDYPGKAHVISGGTGYDIGGKLPLEIDQIRELDYSIYNCDYSMQFFSRGCVRRCPFCVVREKEGYIRPVEPMSLNPKGKHIEILDNNFFANPEWKKAVQQIHIAWDNPRTNMETHIRRMLKQIKPYKIMCYVLIGYWSTPDQDLNRVERLRELGVDPFVMAFDKSDPYQRRFARWVNHKATFKSVPWRDYRR